MNQSSTTFIFAVLLSLCVVAVFMLWLHCKGVTMPPDHRTSLLQAKAAETLAAQTLVAEM